MGTKNDKGSLSAIALYPEQVYIVSDEKASDIVYNKLNVRQKNDTLPSEKIKSTFKGSKANSVSNAIITESEQKINTSGD